MSPPLEAVAAGLALRRFKMNLARGKISHKPLDRCWRATDEIQNAILFVLLGFEVLVIAFTRSSFESGGLATASVRAVRLSVVALSC
jgi:CPA1 family monovalent cation:H+ antiporter